MRWFALCGVSGCVWLDAGTHADRRVAATPLDLRVESLDGGPWPACDAALPFEATLSVDREYAGRELELVVHDGDRAVFAATAVPTLADGRAVVALSGELAGVPPADALRVALALTASFRARSETWELDVPVEPDAPRWVDADGDGFGGPTRSAACDPDAALVQGDCDDLDPDRAPGLPERCDGLDSDCDGQVPADEADADADGWAACAPFFGAALQGGGDCDDAPGGHERNPGESERCNQIDDDCDGVVPPDEEDGDGDGWVACDGWSGDEGLGLASGDCDGGNIEVHPSAAERCDGLDNDCDGLLDPREEDGDGDGYLGCTAWEAAGNPPLPLGDCDEVRPSVYPGADEICDGLDSNCDGTLPPDEDDPDGDQWIACGSWMGPSDADLLGGGDCAPDDGHRHPGAPERCNGLDDDCADGLPFDEQDPDDDGFVACEDWIGDASLASGDCGPDDPDRYPGADELCDAVDQDCDGFIDEGDPGGFFVGGTTYPTFVAALAHPGIGNLSLFACEDLPSFYLPSGRLVVELQAHAAQPVVLASGAQLTLRGGALRADASTRALTATGARVVLDHMVVEGDPDGAHPVEGGCVRVESATDLTATATAFTGCRAQTGGAIHASDSVVSLAEVAFEGNRATGEGGAIFLTASVLDAQDTTWLGNEAGTRGGAVRATAASVVDVLGESWFEANSADDEGGALHVDGVELALTGTRLEANRAMFGGALVCGPAGAVTATDARFVGNGVPVPAAQYGGAATLGDGCAATFTGGAFQLNVAAQGGGALVLGRSLPTDLTPTAAFSAVDFGQSGTIDSRNTPDAVRTGVISQSYSPTGLVDGTCDADACSFP